MNKERAKQPALIMQTLKSAHYGKITLPANNLADAYHPSDENALHEARNHAFLPNQFPLSEYEFFAEHCPPDPQQPNA